MSFRKLAVSSLIATFALIAIGALVRSTGSGLGCSTSWPDCSGSLIPDFTDHHVVIEFTHRVVAGIVMILIGTLAVKAYRARDRVPNLFLPSAAAFGLVLVQALLGALVVKLELEAGSVVIHLSAALSLFALLLYINFLALERSVTELEPTDDDVAKRARWAAGSVFLLMLVGSYMSGIEGAGRAVSDWPLMGGRLVPNLGSEEMAMHFLHRLLAAAVGVFLFVVLMGVIRRRGEMATAARLAHTVLGLFAVEIMIGALNVWTDLNALIVVSHLAVGTLIWGSLVTMALVTSPRLREKMPAIARRVTSIPSEQGAS